MSAATDTPVLLLAFNRPDTTARVFEAISKARPSRLYVAVDGPRASRPREAALCAEVKRIVSAVDWPCELRTLFRDENLGCKRGVSSAIDWFFAAEEQGIILEDDCLPSPSFFRFCEELLARYRDDRRVFSVQGNFFGARRTPQSSYLFSKIFYMWGWATWADRWRAVDLQSLSVQDVRRSIVNDEWLGSSPFLKAFWLNIAEQQAAGRIDSWGYPVMFHCFTHKLFNATPTRNLVLNIGDGPSATRTIALDCGPFHREAQDIQLPLTDCPKYEGPEQLLRLEHKWRLQARPSLLAKSWMSGTFPRSYGLLKQMLQYCRRT
jgi:hypothetical protein